VRGRPSPLPVRMRALVPASGAHPGGPASPFCPAPGSFRGVATRAGHMSARHVLLWPLAALAAPAASEAISVRWPPAMSALQPPGRTNRADRPVRQLVYWPERT
jgi:hypothetical protein